MARQKARVFLQRTTSSESGSRWLTEAGGRAIVGLLLAVKLAATAWNGVVFDGDPYDSHHHVQRAAVGGLSADARNYDAPTYYLPALVYSSLRRGAWREHARQERIAGAAAGSNDSRPGRPDVSPFLAFLRSTNFVYVAAFYLLWIYAVLPRVIADPSRRLLAALLLLSLPGYQKMAAMPHPDNLHVLMATLATAVWLRMPRVSTTAEGDEASCGSHLGMALVTGLAGLTRPFAAATVATGAAFNLAHVWLTETRGVASFLRRAVVVTLLTAGVAGSWMAWRGLHSGQWREAYPEGYIEKFDRNDFDWAGHLTTFHFAELLRIPNRNITRLDESHWSKGEYDPKNRYANSLMTILYSETWGDHWLYFSGPVGADRKVMAKRVIFVLALPLLPLLLLRFTGAAAGLLREAAKRGLAVMLDPSAFLLTHVVSGAALFLVWHLGSGLTPGKNSSIKFIYVAYLYAPAVTLCFTRPIRSGFVDAWLGYLLVIFLAALPVAVFVPKGW